MPKKTFSSGETLLASDVNTYLMNQTVMVFDDSSARSTAIPSPAEGMVTYVKDVDLVQAFDGSDWIEISGGASVTVSETAPSGAEAGDMWFSSSDGRTFVYYTDVDGSQWVEIGTVLGGGGASIEVAATAPASPSDGDLWWDTDNGNLYLYYNDGTSSQWVAANGPQVFVGTSAPDGYQGQLWFDSTDGKTYIYYDDGTSGQWVSAIGGSLAGNVIQVVHATSSSTTTTTSTSAVDTDLTATITPSSTSSRIVIIVSGTGSTSGTTSFGSRFHIYRGGSAGTALDGLTSMFTQDNVSRVDAPVSVTFTDSPATTSAVTYTLCIYSSNSANTAEFNKIGYGNMTLMEIAG